MTAKAKSPRATAALPSSLAARLAAALAPTDVAPARLAAMRDKVLARVREETPRFVTVRSADGEWVALAPDVAYKILHDDGALLSFLLKLDAGARYPRHEHPGGELSFVVAGECTVDGTTYCAGDFQVARAGSEHGELWTRSGCVLLIQVPSDRMPRVVA